MTSGAGCREIRHALGVYVLGAIDPAERALVDEHLATCPECREELAGLAGVAALLHRVPTYEAERLAAIDGPEDWAGELPSQTMLKALLARTARVRRARRWRALAAAAAVVVLAAGAGAAGAGLLGSSHPAGPAAAVWQTRSGTDSRTGASMTVKYEPALWGTAMNVQVAGIAPGTVCQFHVVDVTGRRWTVGSWTVNYQRGHPWYPASTALPEKQLRWFELTADGKVIARVRAG